MVQAAKAIGNTELENKFNEGLLERACQIAIIRIRIRQFMVPKGHCPIMKYSHR